MFYSHCKKCGKVRRWLTEEESLDKDVVADNLSTSLTLEEFDAAVMADTGKNPKVDRMNVIEVSCAGCETKKVKKTKKEKVEA